MIALTSALRILPASAGGTWKDHPARVALAVIGIACGVALGVAVHLINASAAAELERAVRSLSGSADAVVRGPRSGFPDASYARIARLPQVRAASPAVELDAQLANRSGAIKVLGIDPFRAAQVHRQLLAGAHEALPALMEGGGVLLSRAAGDALGLRAGDPLRLHAGSGIIELRVLAVLPAGATDQQLAVMDIADAQWRLGTLGTLQRIDVTFAPGVDIARFRAAAAGLLPAGVLVASPESEAERDASIARAYRVNLDMLALVALFTGGFLVFSTQFLALLRRRTQLAVLRVLGVTRAELLRLLVAEGALVGVVASIIGVALGIAVARFGVAILGGDLGAGYFRAVTPALAIDPAAVVVYFALGVLFAALGAAVPALEAARRAPALALKAGDEESALQDVGSGVLGAALVALGIALSQAPPVHGLPVFGYVSLALILLGALLAMPRFAEIVLARLPPLRHVPAALASAQLQATPRQSAISLAAIVASFGLTVSMVIMTASFRSSLEHWLDRMLPADLYVRAGRLGDTGFFGVEDQQRIAAARGVKTALFGRTQNVFVRADRPALTLLARAFVHGRPLPELPVSSGDTRTAGSRPSAWLSEIAADALGARAGDIVELPIGNRAHGFEVAGVWRDYARQNGAIVIDRAVYIAMTGDGRANEAALFLEPGVNPDEAVGGVRSAFEDPAAVEIVSTRELREISLGLFDRTFAVTYALEAAAVLIGLFGVSASFSAQALARRREFGVLRHLGMSRREIGAMLACEGVIVGALGVAAGFAVGWLMSLVLVHVVNRQSFHWTMDMHMPWTTLLALGACLLAAASATAVVSGRRAMSRDVVLAVREDW